jgi:hypothetical protein
MHACNRPWRLPPPRLLLPLAGAQTLTKTQVIERGSAICRAAESRVEATPGGPPPPVR